MEENNDNLEKSKISLFDIENIDNAINNEIEENPKQFLSLSIEQAENVKIGEKIRCPKCENNAVFIINPDKYTVISDCICKTHHEEDLNLMEFIQSSNKHQDNKIPCCGCKKINNGRMYKCYCKKYFCEECKNKHLGGINEDEKDDHNIVEFAQKDFMCCCDERPKRFTCFCKKCSENLCLDCSGDHRSHELFTFDKEIISKEEEEEINNNFKKQQKDLEQFYQILKDWKKEINLKIDLLKKHLQLFVDINQKVIQSYSKKDINYESIINMRNLKFNFTKVFYDLLKSKNDDLKIRTFFLLDLLKYQDGPNNVQFLKEKKSKNAIKDMFQLKTKKQFNLEPNSVILSLCELKKVGCLAFGTESGKINIFDNNTFEELFSIDESDNKPIYYLHELKNGKLIFCTDGGFKILEIYKNKEENRYLLKQAEQIKEKKLNIYGEQVLELQNDLLLSLDGKSIKLWQKNLINEIYVLKKTVDVKKPINYLVGINIYKFCVYTNDGLLKIYDTKSLENKFDIKIIDVKNVKKIEVNAEIINRIYKINDDILILFNEKSYSLISLVKKQVIKTVDSSDWKYIGECVLEDNSNRIIVSYSNKNLSNHFLSEMQFSPVKESIICDINTKKLPFPLLVRFIYHLNSGQLVLTSVGNKIIILN